GVERVVFAVGNRRIVEHVITVVVHPHGAHELGMSFLRTDLGHDAAELTRSAPPAASKSDPWSDLALTLPLFVAYHLGVVFLPVRNGADVVTLELAKLADNDLLKYGALTLAIGVVFVTVLAVLGRHRELRWQRFAWAAAEGILYAFAMRLAAGYVVGKL